MRKRSIKFISILLLLLMSVLCFVACSSDDQGDGLENYKQNAITEITSVRAEYMDSLYSLENIEALNLILEDAKSKISAATEKSQIDIIVSQAKNNFSKINTMKQEEENREDANKKELAIYKRQRQTELDEYRAMLDDSKYSSVNVKELNEIVSIAKNDIFYSETFEEVLKIYNDAVIAIFAVPTIDQEIELLLQAAREEAISALKNYRENKDDDNYSTENCANMDRIVESTISQIEAAITIEDIENLLQHAFELLDAVEPFGQSELEKTKIKEIEALNIYHFGFDYNLYTVSGQAELDGILEDAIKRIQEADSEEDIVEIVGSAKTAFHEVKTYAELFAEYKPKAEEKLRQYRASKLDEAYSAEGVNSLNLILRNALSAISNATTFEAVDNIVKEAVAALDDVNVLETELIKIKNSKIGELIEYRNSFASNDYTENGIKQLDQILEIGKQNILNASVLAEVNREFESARMSMNAVLTIAQELAQKKAVAVQELNDYRLQFNDDNYSGFGINALNTALSNGIDNINSSSDLHGLEEALRSAKKELDDVLDYNAELQYRKEAAIKEINDVRNHKNEAAYSESGIENLDRIVITYTNQISALTIVEDVNVLKLQAIEELNSVPIYSQQLKIEIAQKVVEIKDYHAEKLAQKYTDDGAVLLEMALQNGIIAIQNAKSLEQLYEAFAQAKINLDEIKTYEEELSDAKQAAENSLRLYRDTKLNSLYTQDGIELLNNILFESVEDIWEADNFISVNQILEESKSKLDEVPTHQQELVSYKLILIEDLREYRARKQNVNYSDEGVEKLNQALQNGIDGINNAQTIEQAQDEFNRAKINLDSVPNLNQGIQIIQENACAALRAHRNSKNNSDYTSDGVQALDNALSDGLQRINSAITEETVIAALNQAISTIDAIKSIFDLLSESKANALVELRAYRETKKDSDYSNHGISLLNDALRDGEIAIDRAVSIEEVESALQAAKNALDLVLTESEENNFDIWELRAKALEELEAFRIELGEDNYGPNGKAQLEDILMNAMAEVSEASTPSELEQVVQATKEKMKGVLTFKSEYQNEIYSYRNSFVDTDYTSDGLSALDAATQKYASLIMDCLNIDSAKQVYFEAIQTMDNVLQKDGNNRFKIKQSAIDEITLYRENKSRAEYDDNGNEMLDKLLADTVHNIEKSIGSEQINELIMNAKKRMDDVLTNAQNQALTWADQYRDIFDDNEYSDENIDILDSLIDEFKDNILNHISLQDAKIKVAREMDSVATISGSCRQTVKDVYIDDLRKYKETFVLSNYSSNAIAVLESLFLKGTSEIQLSYDLDSSLFETAVSKAKVAMDAVLTLKDEAVAELEAYRATFDESEYSAESIAELDKILTDFIDAAIEPSHIQIALNEVKAAMDAVLTLKDEAVAELEAYRATFDESEYSAESIAELDKILTDFINAEIEPSQIQIALDVAKAAMDAVLTLKDEAVAELEAYRATFDESEYSAESIAELDKILTDFIDAAIEPSHIQIALNEVKAAMDAVLTLRDEAVAELEAYRAMFDESEYSAESIAELDKILSDFINAAIEPSQIQIALGEAKAAMDAVLTLKDEAVAELEAYRATFDESEYSAEAVAELDKILSDFINAAIEPSQIQIALGEAKATMDAVLSE